MKYLTYPTLMLLMASCGIYNTQFDCPAGKGVGCAPVHDVIDLIVEKKEGEDVFVKDKGTALLLREQEAERLLHTPTKARRKYHLVQNESGEWTLVKLLEEKEE